MKRLAGILVVLGFYCAGAGFAEMPRKVAVYSEPGAGPRVKLGVEKLGLALKAADYVLVSPSSERIVVGTLGASPTLQSMVRSGALKLPHQMPGKEGFVLVKAGPATTAVAGVDDSGTLYGALELADRIKAAGMIPATLNFQDAPIFVLRGPCIGMQKQEITYDGAIYDYRYTPEEFPFFYDRQHWTRYLDFLLENRMNTLYLWNGHPFTSLLKLPKYPDAQELTDQQLARNMEMFRWLTAEADRRGIWVIQFFYNIHISHALARSRGVAFQHSAPTPLTSEYTRYCISEFIRNYPNVGLLMTLGEALAAHHGPEWLTKTIIPGVKDGMRAANLPSEPPIIVRAHGTEIERAIKDALPLYSNIYTMHKYNGESLSWTDVRGEDRRMHQSLVSLGSTHIVNVHLLANLEPFRWGSPEYVQQCVQSCRRIGIKGLHLYPLRYWEWPVTADNVTPLLQQIDRDWIWFASWARYAWNPDREPAAERRYWAGRLGEKFGTVQAGEKILDAYQYSGVCAPRLLPRLGITGGGRQSFTLGMLMTQLINPTRYGPWELLWTADGPPGERLEEWAQREWEGRPHQGETPPQEVEETAASAARAVAAAEAAAPDVTRNRDEYLRFANDMRAIAAQTRFYRAKALAAAQVLRYRHSRDFGDLKRALPLLEQSVAEYRALVALTDRTYRQACALHTPTRRIPFVWSPGRYMHWRQALPEYERELANFRSNLQRVRATGSVEAPPAGKAALPAVPVKLLSPGAEPFEVAPGARLYTDRDIAIQDLAPELRGLQGIRIPYQAATEKGVSLQFELPQPAQILVGFFQAKGGGMAARAPANEWEPVLVEGVTAASHPKLTVYTHALPVGRNNFDFGKGAYVVLGFITREASISPRLVYSGPRTGAGALDWLFE